MTAFSLTERSCLDARAASSAFKTTSCPDLLVITSNLTGSSVSKLLISGSALLRIARKRDQPEIQMREAILY